LLNCPGAVGMARDEGPDTAVTEIYIPLLPRRYLDRNYTIVGRVISGMDTVNRLARVAPSTEAETDILFGDAPVAAAEAAAARAGKLARTGSSRPMSPQICRQTTAPPSKS
jgi:peptidylprolyl isomerase